MTWGDARPAVLAVHNLTVSYDRQPVLRGVNFNVERGEVLGIVGPNGAGKSTILKAILGLIPFESGQILIDGQPAADRRGRVAYVPQRGDVDWDFPATAFDVVMMGRYGRLGWLRRPGPADQARTRRALADVKMEESADIQIGRLSGGQQQRVFLARALTQDTDILILDEPFVGIDATSERVIFAILADLRSAGCTIVIVNHDLSVVDRYDRLMLLNGYIVALGHPQEVFTAENLRRAYGGRVVSVGEGARVVAP
ncbi:MAG: metal ABC transporter ATP-binding protein [Thermaerobacterales bacterium]